MGTIHMGTPEILLKYRWSTRLSMVPPLKCLSRAPPHSLKLAPFGVGIQGLVLWLTKRCRQWVNSLLSIVLLIWWQLVRKVGQDSREREVPSRSSPTPLQVDMLLANLVFVVL